MTSERATVVSCPLGADLLDVLAERLRDGSLIPEAAGVPLFQWRIFLPTRRAVRRLRQLLAAGSSMVLPDIRPIGDIDEDELAAQVPSLNIPDAISPHGLLFEVMALLATWARDNPRFPLAHDVSASATRLQHLAQSLVELLDQAETEERPLSGIEAVYDLDLAGHREAILDLLNVIATALPAKLAAENCIGPSARRNLLIREQAAHLRHRSLNKPVVIAGSTGTNPATRELMAAIAAHPSGLVILPGLASEMAAADWLTLQPTHPQYNLKILLDTLQLAPDAIPDFGCGLPERRWLMQETMRPAQSSSHWNETLRGQEQVCVQALRNLKLVTAPDRHGEALAIALILRKAHVEGSRNIALVTPDPDLARRVAIALRRWDLAVDDTQGAKLPDVGKAQLLASIMDARLDDFAPASLLALLHHPLADFGMTPEARQQALQLFDMFVLRQPAVGGGHASIARAFERATLHRARAHDDDAIKSVTDDAWQTLAGYVARSVAAFAALAADDPRSLAGHIAVLVDCLELVSTEPPDRIAAALALALEELTQESHRLGPMSFGECVPLIVARLQRTTLRPRPGAARIGIYGLLEARLMHFDVVVLGGLNEGKWPTTPDTGPWLNRPMRNEFGLQQPERNIGLTAHDFVGQLASPDVTLTWAERIGTEPAIPSRWILRLRAVMEACGLPTETHCDTVFTDIAPRLDRPQSFHPVAMPRPKLAAQQIPRSFSVTEIETLVRDPYAIFARKVLGLKPIEGLAAEPDASLRGILFHEAIRRWNEQQPHGAVPASLDVLLAAGEAAFQPIADDPEVQAFWWPRFVRMATWLHAAETELRQDVLDTHAEVSGKLEPVFGGEAFAIRAKADRIDVFLDGTVRIIDYKTGEPPSTAQVASGFSPQLTLEAALVRNGAFKRLGGRKVVDALYVKASGAREPGRIVSLQNVKNGFGIADKAQEHWAGLERRLTALLDPDCTYPPRVNPFKADADLKYDHLSRYLEWSLLE